MKYSKTIQKSQKITVKKKKAVKIFILFWTWTILVFSFKSLKYNTRLDKYTCNISTIFITLIMY